ncbi:hypothetical protein Q5P01_006360 [Channa striata]|uniref:Uncharacterized protein n=1 Tax=Channa striata TaxID=64152 RepID=A0AA88T0Q0_CHASR|nr:hypothetical protein Q5P01_006360 [Channa striata]
MKNLLTGILGLLAVIHPAYVNTVILTEPESDDLQDSMKDEFLIPSLATQLPKRNTTIQSFSDSSDHKESVTHAQGFTSTVVSVDKVDSRVWRRGDARRDPATSSARPDVSTTLSETTLETTSETTITAGEGSDSELVTTEKLSDSTPVKEEMHQQTFLENVQRIPPSGPQTSETPRWIIILGLLVGIAVVVIVGVAIATREKWIGPSQVHQLETQTNSSNQQRELEMKTFLNKDKPKENGKAGEYTIIPLDELPQSSTSH